MVGYSPPRRSNCQECTGPATAGCKGPDTERMQTTDLCFLAKKQTINSWRLTHITTCLICCGRSSWPEIAGLSVPWVCYDIQGLVVSLKKGMKDNTSHMLFHALIIPEESQNVSRRLFRFISKNCLLEIHLCISQHALTNPACLLVLTR